MEKRIVVPEGMLKAAAEALFDQTMILNGNTAQVILEAALRWLSENPIVPTGEQIQDMYQRECEAGISFTLVARFIAEWQRRMFLAPEPEVPEAVMDLWRASPTPDTKRRILEAYKRGLKGSKQ